jgi:sulfopyruvate decarboxylase TPP-binding subunit
MLDKPVASRFKESEELIQLELYREEIAFGVPAGNSLCRVTRAQR